jgi:hypothetical protein
MMRFLSPFLRAGLALALAAGPAAAQVEFRAAPEIGVSAVPTAAPFALGTPATLPRPAAPPSAPALTSSWPAAAAPAAAGAAAAVPLAASDFTAAEAIAAPAADAAAAPSAAPGAVLAAAARDESLTPLLAAVSAAARPAAPGAPNSSPSGRWRIFFDGAARSAAASDGLPVAAASAGEGAPALTAAAHPAASARATVPSPRRARPRAGSRLIAGAAVAAAVVLLLAAAAPAFAATGAAAVAAAPLLTAATTLSVVSALHPAASAIGAAAGVLYGLIASKNADGSAPDSGRLFASAVRYGVLGGAGVYVLLDLTQMAFTGFSAAAVNPLSVALTTAALAHTAFGGKFADPATTSADRITGAFPAVAAAMGLHVSALLALSAATWPHALAAGAMSATGLAAAFYAALFTPGRSAADGPARMAKGWVLQALMGGLALAVGNLWLAVPLAALAVWGFGDAMFASGQEFWSAAKAFLNKSNPPAPGPKA